MRIGEINRTHAGVNMSYRSRFTEPHQPSQPLHSLKVCETSSLVSSKRYATYYLMLEYNSIFHIWYIIKLSLSTPVFEFTWIFLISKFTSSYSSSFKLTSCLSHILSSTFHLIPPSFRILSSTWILECITSMQNINTPSYLNL